MTKEERRAAAAERARRELLELQKRRAESHRRQIEENRRIRAEAQKQCG